MQQADIHTPGRPLAAQDQAASLRAPKRATQLSLFIAGFALSSWAPLVPFAQQRLGADAATLGSVLLCLGLGAVIGMPGAGALVGRVGCKALIVTAGLVLAAVLPLMAIASTAFSLGLCLLIFGAATGAIDVAANVHGTEVQRIARQPLMSGFHGLYSIGGLVGAAAMTAIIAAGASAAAATLAAGLVIALCVLRAAPGFLVLPPAKTGPLLIVPRGVVAGIGLLAMVIFLAEGAMLDWSALLLSRDKGVDQRFAGVGYSVFACAMTLIRFVGDRLVTRAGERVVLVAGFLITAGGLALAAWSSHLAVVYPAIALAGLAAGNVVPILFSLAGRQTLMPPSQAIAAASMLGYLGVLLGPAVLGYAAHAVGLIDAFLWLAGLVALSAVAIRLVVRR
ncbi:MFS transporter [Achromobacter spanius]|uniref:MFS transporter n=1 Tax=Achromobacter spanius TaxID=217203 RepID=A0A2S0IDH4_9BURK|nr:MFS transporter [Achromobacter spanius]AVJ30085.1 MFS transporter [Achromobacter spanius]